MARPGRRSTPRATPLERAPALLTGIEICGHVAGDEIRDSELRHSGERVDLPRVLDPSRQIIAAVRQHAGDVSARGQPCQWRSDIRLGSLDTGNGMAASTAPVLNGDGTPFGIA